MTVVKTFASTKLGVRAPLLALAAVGVAAGFSFLAPQATAADADEAITLYDRFEQVSCGVRTVSYVSSVTIVPSVPENRVNDVAAIGLAFDGLNDGAGEPVQVALTVDRGSEDRDGRAALVYPPETVNKEAHDVALDTVCANGTCSMYIPLYAYEMLPIDGPQTVDVGVVATDVGGNRLSEQVINVTIPPRQVDVGASRFEDFSVTFEGQAAAIRPLPGYENRVRSYALQLEDADGWREIDLTAIEKAGDIWLVQWVGDLKYFGVVVIDATGAWKNKIELVNLNEDWGFQTYDGQCR
ncbi:MAG: hypothetical protein KI792_09960 [Alphaproteobacteria bacterium]|nr:hypothetical protein [Alphaproteobacteria bacterium SS10]